MTWFGALGAIIRISFALAIGKAGYPQLSERLMPVWARKDGDSTWTI